MSRKSNKTKTRKPRGRKTARPILVEPVVNTGALADALIKFMLASEKQIVRKFAGLRDAQLLDCELYGDAVYVPGTRTGGVLLVAHYDTVWDGKRIGIGQRGYTLGSDRKGTGIGADDRAGVCALWLLRNSGHAMLIVPAEEVGCQGSRIVASKYRDLLELHSYAIQFDRCGGHDLVTYDCANDEFDRYLLEAFPGYSLSPGSYSDISELCPAAGIAGVNVSIGFRNEHTSGETLDLLDFARTLSITRALLARADHPRFDYVDGWVNDHDVWGDIDAATAVTGSPDATHALDIEIAPITSTRDELDGLWDEYTKGRIERWCHACGTISYCDDDGECDVCGSDDTESFSKA